MAQSTTDKKKRILHLDDDEVVTEFYQEVLHEHGYAVTHVHKVSECITTLEQDPAWDALLLDVMMPHADVPELDYAQTDDGLLTGVFVAQKIQEMLPDLPIIILTSRVPKIVAQHLDGVVFSKDIKSKFEFPPFEFARYLDNRL